MITDTVRKSLEGIKAEAHILLSSLPHTEEEFKTRLETMSKHLLSAGSGGLDIDGMLERAIRTRDSQREAAEFLKSRGDSRTVSEVVAGVPVESHNAGIVVAVTTNSELVIGSTIEPVEPVVSLGTESNIGASGTE